MCSFCDRGYDGSTTREIAARAHVNEVTLFRHFGTKEELFREVLRCHSPLRIVSAEEGIHFSGDLRADLRALAKTYLDVGLPMSGIIRLFVREAGRTPELQALAEEIPLTLRRHLASYLRQHAEKPTADLEIVAHLFYAVLFHSVLRHGEECHDLDPYVVGQALADLIASALHSDSSSI